MGINFGRIRSYVSYLRKGQSNLYIHSPFVFDFYNKLLKNSRNDEQLKEILLLRKAMRSDEEIVYENMGSGDSSRKSLKELESKVAVRHKFGKLLYKICKYYDLKNIIELGTNIGLSTLYLSRSGAERKICTIEGSEGLYELAKRNFSKWNCENVKAIHGSFEDRFEEVLRKTVPLDLIFFDGNHNKKATLEYFNIALKYKNEKTIFIFDDIYWSEEMTEAWNEIKANKEVIISLDLYQFGLVFFDTAIKVKQDFTLYY